MHQDYKNAIQHFFDEQTEVSLFWKGRVALYAILKAFNISKGDEVIIPAFTCIVVPNAILYLQGKPVYTDIESDTLNVNTVLIEEKITSRTKAIIAQNTFGLAPDLDKIMEIAEKHNIPVIEDCTHGFGGTYKNRKNGSVADISFFSTQWNKPFSTGIGGFAITRDKTLAARLKEAEESAQMPSFREEMLLKLQLLAKPLTNSDMLYWPMINLYRELSRRNIVVGSSGGAELRTAEMPDGFFKKSSKIQASKGISEIGKIEEMIAERKRFAYVYISQLHDWGKWTMASPAYADHTWLKFPIRVKNRDQFMEDARKNKIALGDWFLSPIHPVTRGLEKWMYRKGENPMAEKISSEIVNLPNHPQMSGKKLNKVLEFLNERKDQIIAR